jgi:hypothetical protein
MPPFFFDFFFLAFVGLFTRLHICNGLCLRILPFSSKPIFPNRFPRRAIQLRWKIGDFSSSRYFRFFADFFAVQLKEIPPENLSTRDHNPQGSLRFAFEQNPIGLREIADCNVGQRYAQHRDGSPSIQERIHRESLLEGS